MISRDKFEKLMKRYNEAMKFIESLNNRIEWNEFKIREYKKHVDNHEKELEIKRKELREQEFILEEIRRELGVM